MAGAVHSGGWSLSQQILSNLTALHSHLSEAMGFDLADHELLCEQLKKPVCFVGPGLKGSERKPAILHMIFEQVSSQQVLILDGVGAISLFAALSLTCQRLAGLYPHQKNGKTVRLDLASQTEDKSRRAVQNFPKGTVIVEKGYTPSIWTRASRRPSARMLVVPIKQQGVWEIPGRDDRGEICGSIPTGQSL